MIPVYTLVGHLLVFPEVSLGLYEVLLEFWTSIGDLVPTHLKILLIFPISDTSPYAMRTSCVCITGLPAAAA